MFETLRYQETDQVGSFIAYGVGSHYIFDANTVQLYIFSEETAQKVASFSAPKRVQKDPRQFVYLLEKASNIKALILSSNQTVDVSETIEASKIEAIVTSVYELALQSYDLANMRFGQFSKQLIDNYGIEDIQIKKMRCGSHSMSSPYFRAYIQTKNGNDFVVRDSAVYRILKKMSRHIISELIPIEFGVSQKRNMADQLVLLSSKLSILSRILNDMYHPHMQLNTETTILLQASDDS